MYKSIDLHLDKNQKLFLKKSKPNIYTIFSDLDETMLKCKYKYFKIEFHLHYNKGSIFFVRYINYKNGRTTLSCMKEMIGFLNKWNVNGVGHFVVLMDEQI